MNNSSRLRLPHERFFSITSDGKQACDTIALQSERKGDVAITMKLTPYLLFDGNCAEAMTFYKVCLGGELTITTLGDSPMKGQFPTEQHKKVVNSRLTSGAIDISASDWRVDQYISSLPDWQQNIARQVRDLVHAADPDVTETIKRTDRPYFTLDGNICALQGTKNHLNIFIYDPIAPDPEGIINQGQGNLTARALQVRQGETINPRALLNLFQEVIKNNRAGGWRKGRGNQ